MKNIISDNVKDYSRDKTTCTYIYTSSSRPTNEGCGVWLVYLYILLCLGVTAPGEKDMIVMHHNVGVTWPDKSQEKRVINFVCYGEENGYSAMAKTVGLPTAIATKMVLDGKLSCCWQLIAALLGGWNSLQLLTL